MIRNLRERFLTASPSVERLEDTIERIDETISTTMERYAVLLLRVSIGVNFMWFGILKPFGLSPAEPLANQLVLNFMNLAGFTLPFYQSYFWFLGWSEVLIGALFLFRPTLRVGIFLFFVQIPFTVLPLILVPDMTFTQFPYALTLEGQYIIKNMVLVSAAIAIGGSVRDNKDGR